jgi:hypothetical protein
MALPDTSHISFTYPPAASMWVITLHYLLCNRNNPYSVTFLPIGSGYFRAKPSPVWIPLQFSNSVILHLSAYEDVCSETSAYKIQTPGNYPEENMQQTLYPLYTALRGPQRGSERVRKIPSLPGFDLRTVHAAASHYTD